MKKLRRDANMREEAKWWISDAKRSLVKAESNYGLKYYEDCVFLCQQSLEKLMKGLTIHLRKKRPTKTHKLLALYKPLEKHVKLNAELKDFLAEITPYYFITRYPDIAMGLPSEVITKRFAHECLSKTKRVFKCFQKVISEK